MIRGYSPLQQALFGSLFTWGLTALGAAGVFLFSPRNRTLLDGSLGFAAGVMTAASFWSLLDPALEITEKEYGHFSFVPVALGLALGAVFVYLADVLLNKLGFSGSVVDEIAGGDKQLFSSDYDFEVKTNGGNDRSGYSLESPIFTSKAASPAPDRSRVGSLRRRGEKQQPFSPNDSGIFEDLNEDKRKRDRQGSWRRIMLLLIAIVVHNIPEGLVVGVGFGAVGRTPSATFESAVTLAIGIGIQNFPEGLAVSLPLAGLGYSKLKSFWYGQLSGIVEPAAALLGAAAVSAVEPLLPYALAFAAGAMLYVVVDDIVPECQQMGNGRLASWGFILGFVVMMCLDVGLG